MVQAYHGESKEEEGRIFMAGERFSWLGCGVLSLASSELGGRLCGGRIN